MKPEASQAVVEAGLSAGSRAWTPNGEFEAVGIRAGPDPRDTQWVRLHGISRRCRRSMGGGFRLRARDLDDFCRRWLGSRGAARPSMARELRSIVAAAGRALAGIGADSA